MFTKFRRAVCAVCAAAVMAAVSVSASADYTYSIADSKLCDEIKADTQDVNGSEGTFTTKFSDSTGDDFLSLRFRLFNEYADNDFWNSDDVSVSVDVKLETEGKDVIGCMPAFTTNWGWIDPSGYTELKYGEWVTVTESGKHFYEGFGNKKPAYIMFQVRTNWGAEAQGEVTLSVRNFRIETSGAAAVTEPEETTSAADTSAPDEVKQPTAEAGTTSEPALNTEENSAANTADAASTVEEQSTKEATSTISTPDDSKPSQTDATSINVPEMEGEQPQNYSDYYKEESPVVMILIIIGVAAVIVAGAVIGYIIYKKKKYY